MMAAKSIPNRTIHSLVLFIFIVVGFVIYSNSFNVPFIFDDSDNIQNPALQVSELSTDSLVKVAVESTLRERPVVNISFAINYYFGEYNVRGYHLVNILIHVAAAFFLYLLLCKTFRLPVNRDKYKHYSLLPILIALLWLVHPLATQSVTYLVQRMNSMAAMFYVLSVLCYVQGRLTGCRDDEREHSFEHLFWYVACLLSGFLALGSKEIAVTLPAVIFLYEWFFLQDLSWKWLKRKIPWIVALLIFLYCAAYIYLGGNPIGKVFNSCSNRPFSSLERVLTELRVVNHYIGLLIYPNPDRLVFDYNFPLSTSLFAPVSTIFSFFTLLVMFVVAICMAKKERFLAFCIFWFFINLVLESSVICLEIIYEHRTYLPSMFLFAIFPAILSRIKMNKNVVTGILILVILLFGYWTMERNIIWQSPIRFWEDSINKQPMKARGYNNLGVALYKANRFDEAETNFVDALTLLPDFPEAYGNLGLVQVRQNRYNEAENSFKQALAIKNNYIEGNLNLAALYKDQGKFSDALEFYRKIYKRIPDYSVLNKELGQTLLRTGQVEESLVYLQKAYQKLPNDKDLLLDRGEAFMRNGQLEEAIKSYSGVIEIDNGNPAANYNLGLLFTATGKEKAALMHYKKVEISQSTDIPVSYNLGNLYLRLGFLEQAQTSYSKIIATSTVLENAYNNIGLVYIQKGELHEAVMNFQAALRINPQYEMAAQNLKKVQAELQKIEGKQ